MENSEKGAKRKCTKCGTLFFDFGKFPLTCPSCGAELNSLLTNISKRGRPPKSVQPEIESKEKNLEIEQNLKKNTKGLCGMNKRVYLQPLLKEKV